MTDRCDLTRDELIDLFTKIVGHVPQRSETLSAAMLVILPGDWADESGDRIDPEYVREVQNSAQTMTHSVVSADVVECVLLAVQEIEEAEQQYKRGQNGTGNNT